MKTLSLAAIAFVIMIVLDALWIGVIGRDFYRDQLGLMLRPDVIWSAALIFYALYGFVLSFLILNPAVSAKTPVGMVALSAALLGLAAYAAYDLSNLATLRDWPLSLTVVDMAWGTFATAVTGTLTYLIGTKIFHV